MWSLLYNPSAYPSARTHTSSVVGSCFTYKLGMLPVLRFQAELSPSFLWKFTEFRAETPPHAFGIPNCITPPSPSEFQDAARGMVWIFSGITHSKTLEEGLSVLISRHVKGVPLFNNK